MSVSEIKKSHTEVCQDVLEADVIVIGGGAAGCIVMNELSKCYSVLGLEAGGNLTSDPVIQQIGLPAFLLAGTGQSKYFWSGFQQTVPQPGLNGRTSSWTTGFLLGGGSSVNGLYYGRGSNAVYSQWESLSGSSNWSLDNILATFKELENYQGLTMSSARGTNGPVNILQTPSIAPMTLTQLLPAAVNAFPGIPIVTDYNDPSVENCIDPRAQWFINPMTLQRVSSSTAFLGPSVMTPDGFGVSGYNLRVLFNSVVLKIIFDKRRRAKAVQFLRNGRIVEARAKKAVVIASGINSSKILQLSGIGPLSVLVNSKIPPVFINENVGKNLQNHPTLFITLLPNPTDSGVPSGASYAYSILNMFLPIVGTPFNSPRLVQMVFEFIPAGVLNPLPALVLGFVLVSPVSKGSVNVQSDNSFQIAAADDAFYQNPIDLANMVNVVQVYIQGLLNQLASTNLPPFYRPILTDPINEVILSGYDSTVVQNYIKNNTNLMLDVHHFVSHCKMGPLNSGGVVDGDTRVHGTENLFVTDNAICPSIPDINTTGPAMMIGLRSSKIIKKFLRKY